MAAAFIFPLFFSQTKFTMPGTEGTFYPAKGTAGALVVGLSASDRDNVWATDARKAFRKKLTEMGYSFLALRYFGGRSTPEMLERIPLEAIHNAVLKASRNSSRKIPVALLGDSRGGELALLMGSYYPEIQCVISICGSSVILPGNSTSLSSWTRGGRELPYMPVNTEAFSLMRQNNYRAAFEAMLTDSAAVENSVIEVEKISGPILLVSASEDDCRPSAYMAEKMTERLKQKKFPHHYEHLPMQGSEASVWENFDRITDFLAEHFPARRRETAFLTNKTLFKRENKAGKLLP